MAQWLKVLASLVEDRSTSHHFIAEILMDNNVQGEMP